MTLNVSIDGEGLTIWSMLKFFVKVSVAAMPAFLLWTFVQSVVLPFWIVWIGQAIHHP